MKVLVFGIHYHPDLIGIPKYSGEMCEWLASKGHEVEVITGKPFYPNWKVKAEYKKKWWFTENLNGVKVHRCPLFVPTNPTAGKKIIHEGLFFLASLLYWFKCLFSKYDVIITICPPFHIGFLPVLFSKLKKIPHVFHVQDLQVDIASDLQMIKNKSILSFLFSFEKWIMKNSTIVSTISEGMKGKILSKGVESQKMYLFPNWVDSDFIFPLDKSESLKKELNFKDSDRIILYSGNLGEKQGLEYVIYVADLLRSYSDIHFVFVGTGTGKEKIQQLVEEKQLKNNVHFFPLQPYEKLPNLLAMGDLHLVLQKKGASDLILPSKLTSILAAGGCPIVTAEAGTSLHKIIVENNLGFVIEPENTQALKKAILNGLFSEISKMKENGRSFSSENLNKKIILKKLESKLLSTL